MPIVASAVITRVAVPGIMSRPVIGVPIDRGGVGIYRRGVRVDRWWRIRVVRPRESGAEECSPYEGAGSMPTAP